MGAGPPPLAPPLAPPLGAGPRLAVPLEAGPPPLGAGPSLALPPLLPVRTVRLGASSKSSWLAALGERLAGGESQVPCIHFWVLGDFGLALGKSAFSECASGDIC